MFRASIRTISSLLCAAACALTAQAQTATNQENTAEAIPGQIVVNEATTVAQTMKQQPDLAELLDHAKAVLIVPGYGADPSQLRNRAKSESAEGSTANTSRALERYGSPGVFLMHQGGWSAPAFFSVSDVAINAENANATEHGTRLVLIFMTSHGAERMENDAKNVSLRGLKVAHVTDHPAGSGSGADVVIWAPNPTMIHQADLLGAKIHYDHTGSNAYYTKPVTLNDILANNHSTTRANQLQTALSTRVASK